MHYFCFNLLVCLYVCEVYVHMCVQVHVQKPQEGVNSFSITLYLIPLRQGPLTDLGACISQLG